MHNYSTYGKTISSDLSLSLLNPCNIKQDCDITIKSSARYKTKEINSKNFLYKNNVGMFEIRNEMRFFIKHFQNLTHYY